MKPLYFYDPATKELDHIELVDKDVAEKDNSTFIVPANGLWEPITFDGTAWSGSTKEKWETAHPAPTPTPTAEQQTIAQLTQMVTGMMAKEATTNV